MKTKAPSMDSAPETNQNPAYRNFLTLYPSYEETEALDRLREREFSRLDRQDHVYLDYTGGGLYGECQVHRHSELLRQGIMGNPHSSNPSSVLSTDLVERCRRRVLEFFNAAPEEYVVIFEANASHALKLVGESYPFEDGEYLLTFDNHNSVNGMREYARRRGSDVTYIPLEAPELRVSTEAVLSYLDRPAKGKNRLFSYPAQSNFSGVKHPLAWVALAQERGWDVLLDAAAFVPTNRLDLGLTKPDYVALSFYKMFGHPTGVGALIARREALGKLRRPWFAGGTITVASVQADQHFFASGAEGFEDGTVNFTNIPAVEIGLDFLEAAGVEKITRRVHCLSGWLLHRLQTLKHSTGESLIRLYGPRDTEDRGGTITVNFVDESGSVIDHDLVEQQANSHCISLRTGCFCNPGAGELAMGIGGEEIAGCFNSDDGSGVAISYNDFRLCVDAESTGAVRISLGIASNFADTEAFIAFARSFLR